LGGRVAVGGVVTVTRLCHGRRDAGEPERQRCGDTHGGGRLRAPSRLATQLLAVRSLAEDLDLRLPLAPLTHAADSKRLSLAC
jgi:hypothetical protein